MMCAAPRCPISKRVEETDATRVCTKSKQRALGRISRGQRDQGRRGPPSKSTSYTGTFIVVRRAMQNDAISMTMIPPTDRWSHLGLFLSPCPWVSLPSCLLLLLGEPLTSFAFFFFFLKKKKKHRKCVWHSADDSFDMRHARDATTTLRAIRKGKQQCASNVHVQTGAC